MYLLVPHGRNNDLKLNIVCLTSVTIILSRFALLPLNCCRFYSSGGVIPKNETKYQLDMHKNTKNSYI